jgi:hypothetical protein
MIEELQVPEHIAARIAAREASGQTSAVTEALAGFPSIPRISIRGSRYRLVEGSAEETVGTELDVVIVGVNPNTSKVFFEGEYDPDAGEVMPTCQSANGKVPDASVEFPVCDSCAQCPNNVLGSKITAKGSKSKICGDVRYIAVVPAADPTKVYSMNISVMAMKPLRVYSQSLANYGIIAEEVVTHLGFDDEASYPLVTFTRGEFLSEKALPIIEQIQATEEVSAACRTNVKPRGLPAPADEDVPAIEKPASNVAKLEKPKAPAATKTAAKNKAPAKKAAAKNKVVEEAVEEDLDEDAESALESKLDDIFG